MHSSRMLIVRFLTVWGRGSASWWSAQPQGVCIRGGVCPTLGVCIQRGLPNPEGSALGGLHPGGSAQSQGDLHWRGLPRGSASRGICPTPGGVCPPNLGRSALGGLLRGVCPIPGGSTLEGSAGGSASRGVCPTPGGLPNLGEVCIGGGLHPGVSAQPRRGLHWGSLPRGSASGGFAQPPRSAYGGGLGRPPQPL